MNFEDLILKDMPDGLNNLEKARYIYLKLAMYLNFNTAYQNTSDFNRAKLYSNGINASTLDFNSNQVICKEWAALYSELLTDVGVPNIIVSSGHSSVNFIYDGKIWGADATNGTYTDLSRIKYGDKTFNFGISLSQDTNKLSTFIIHDEKTDQLLDEIDKKFSFYKEREIELKLLKEKLKHINDSNNTLSDKLEIFFESLGKLKEGYYESKDFVRDLEYNYFSKEEMEKIHGVELKRTNKDLSVDIVQCIYLHDNDKYSYFILAPNKNIRKVNPEEIASLSVLGYRIDNKTIPLVLFPKKFKAGVPTKPSLRYVLLKNSIPVNIKDYDNKQSGPLI
ncbi:MAG: hypothetical protein IK997_01415 [Bacilli bacterium]|nr:hypothetical protein [Bacilli bacterium]